METSLEQLERIWTLEKLIEWGGLDKKAAPSESRETIAIEAGDVDLQANMSQATPKRMMSNGTKSRPTSVELPAADVTLDPEMVRKGPDSERVKGQTRNPR